MAKLTLLLLIFLNVFAYAHEGPPYPLFVDRPTSFGKLSVWTDPDVGIGTFILLLEPSGTPMEEFSAQAGASSKKNQEPFAFVPAERDADISSKSGRPAYVAKVPFDHEGPWNISFRIKGNDEITMEVEVTPPGPTQTEFFIYSLPFLVIGAIWVKSLLMHRSRRKA